MQKHIGSATTQSAKRISSVGLPASSHTHKMASFFPWCELMWSLSCYPKPAGWGCHGAFCGFNLHLPNYCGWAYFSIFIFYSDFSSEVTSTIFVHLWCGSALSSKLFYRVGSGVVRQTFIKIIFTWSYWFLSLCHLPSVFSKHFLFFMYFKAILLYFSHNFESFNLHVSH